MGDEQAPRRSRPSALDTSKFTQEARPATPVDIYELFPPSADDNNNALLTIRPAWKRSLHQLLEQPTSSPAAFHVHMFTTALIVISALITILETVPTFHSISNRVWFGMETTLVALFTVEYVARLVAWSYSWSSLFKWILSFYGIIDLLSVLPYYIELMLRQDTSVLFRFSILRMFRLLRVFRPFRYNHTILLTIEVMYLSVRRSQHALLAIGFFVIMILTVFSTLLYFAERGTWDEVMDTFINVDGDPTQFASIPAAAWFVIVTITTVGYGEITPRSFLGRVITLPILVFGLLLITLPSFVLGREFSLVWQQMTEDKHNHATLEDDAAAAAIDLGLPSSPTSPSTSYPPPQRIHLLRATATAAAAAAASSSRLHLPSTPSSSSLRRTTRVSAAPTPTALDMPYDPFLSHPPPPPPHTPHSQRDLSNLKLAQNQTELSRQISELAEVVEGQGRLLRRLLRVLGEREREGGGGGDGDGEGEGVGVGEVRVESGGGRR